MERTSREEIWDGKQGRGNRKGKFIFKLWLLPGCVVDKAVLCP